ncbi:MAG TPA: hypothetical protein DCE55_19420 [Planctomycetaceae bacterium]|nr:hypothetical protein [Planctomycetaceae bacterium]
MMPGWIISWWSRVQRDLAIWIRDVCFSFSRRILTCQMILSRYYWQGLQAVTQNHATFLLPDAIVLWAS